MVSIMSTTTTTSLAVCLLLVSLGNRTLLLLSPDNTIYSTITTVTIPIKGTDKLQSLLGNLIYYNILGKL